MARTSGQPPRLIAAPTGPSGASHHRVQRWVPARLAPHVPLLGALAVVALIGLPTVNFPYGPDQALFAYIGRGLAHGQTLYVDLWDVKPPGIFWLYALATRLPGGFRGVRAFDLLYTLATVVAVAALGRRLWDRHTGALAGLVYGTVYVSASGYWEMAQPDGFMVLPVVLGVLAWEGGGRSGVARRSLLAGVLFGLAVLLRPVVVLLPAALALRALWLHAGRGPGARRVMLLLAGGALVQVATLLYLAVGGAVGEYLYAQFQFAGHYARLGGFYFPEGVTLTNFLPGTRAAFVWFTSRWLAVWVPALAAVVVGACLRADAGVRLLTLLLAAALLSVVIQTKFFIYHWHIVLVWLALLTAWVVALLWRELRRRSTRRRAAAVVALCAGVLLFLSPRVTRGVAEWRYLVRYVVAPSSRTAYLDRFGPWGWGTYSYRASWTVAHYLRGRTAPGDTIVVWGYDPNVYLMSGRESASRFLSFLPLMPTFTPERWRQEFVADLARKRPAYILLIQGENVRWVTGRPDDAAAWVVQFTAFHELLQREYVFEVQIEDYLIYRRR